MAINIGPTNTFSLDNELSEYGIGATTSLFDRTLTDGKTSNWSSGRMVNAYSIGGFVTLNSYGIDKFAYLCKTGTGSNPVLTTKAIDCALYKKSCS